jgi:hypothetical protein
MSEDRKKGTDRDVRPTRGQESNENWDDMNSDRNDTNAGTGSDARIIDEQTNTSGAGSSQRNHGDNAAGNVGPLDADLEQLPSEKRRDRGSNLTGPGLG